MRQPPPDPDCADFAPIADGLTDYDMEHLVTYIRLLDANTDGVAWTDAARTVLHIDPDRERDQARRSWESHLGRAQWMTAVGYRHLLRQKDLN